jgi:hypothetical protein
VIGPVGVGVEAGNVVHDAGVCISRSLSCLGELPSSFRTCFEGEPIPFEGLAAEEDGE